MNMKFYSGIFFTAGSRTDFHYWLKWVGGLDIPVKTCNLWVQSLGFRLPLLSQQTAKLLDRFGDWTCYVTPALPTQLCAVGHADFACGCLSPTTKYPSQRAEKQLNYFPGTAAKFESR